MKTTTQLELHGESPLGSPSCSRLESVRMGRDPELLDDMLDFYAPTAKRIVDVCCNRRKMGGGQGDGLRHQPRSATRRGDN